MQVYFDKNNGVFFCNKKQYTSFQSRYLASLNPIEVRKSHSGIIKIPKYNILKVI
jgi:hypothetical protein